MLSLSPASMSFGAIAGLLRGLQAALAAPSLGCEGRPRCLGAIFRLHGVSASALFVTPQPSHTFSYSPSHGTLKSLSLKMPPASGLPTAFFALSVSPSCPTVMSALAAASRLPQENAIPLSCLRAAPVSFLSPPLKLLLDHQS